MRLEDHEDLLRVIELAADRAQHVDLAWLDAASLNPWTLTPGALRFVSALIDLLRPVHIIEFGSGVSTLAMAHAVRRAGCRSLISSIDHDPEFGPAAATQFEAAAIADVTVAFQIAPLVARPLVGSFVPTYSIDRAALATQEPADLVVVDGPPDSLGGREGTLYQVLPLCRPGTIVLLDDADRDAEREAMRRWGIRLGERVIVESAPGLERGMGVVLVRDPTLPAEWADDQSTLVELVSSISDERDVVLVAGEEYESFRGLNATVLPFLERDGVYWGAPQDDAHALSELDRHVHQGAAVLVVPASAMWWLEHYRGFERHLAATHRQVPSAVPDARVYDLR